MKNTILYIQLMIVAFIVGFYCGAGAVVDANKPEPLPDAPIEDVRTPMDLTEPRIWNVSAYCPCVKCCGEYSKGKHYRQTASGYKIQAGDKLIAAPKSIPFGTWIDVPGYGRAQVKDRGGAIKEGCLDLYFNTHQEALEWGRQHISVKF